MSENVVLITGASRGLGQAIAVAFAKRGYAVGVNYTTHEAGAKETAQLVERSGGKACLLKANVGSSQAVKDMFAALKAKWGRVDVLINNAGIVRNRTIAKMTDQEWADVQTVLLSGTFYCTREAISYMRAQNGGSIINIISYLATHPVRGASNYAAAKAGVLNFTQSTALEEGTNNIRANAIMPGFHVTDMNKDVWEKMSVEILKQHLLGKISDKEEMAQFVVQISELKSVTGQVFSFESRL